MGKIKFRRAATVIATCAGITVIGWMVGAAYAVGAVMELLDARSWR